MAQLTEARLRKVIRRQPPGRWGADYEPALQVRRNEVPAASRPAILWSQKLGRQVHVMSKAEQVTAFLLLYLPNISDLHEQKILPTGPEEHPLADHFRSLGQQVAVTRGTVKISESLGCLNRHPVVYVEGHPVPFNYIGDFLVYSTDDDGPFCINVSVKNSEEAFTRKHGQILSRGQKAISRNLQEVRRHQIERTLYEEWGIKTIFFSADCIEKCLSYNLTHLFKWHAREVTIGAEEKLEILKSLEVCLKEGLSVHDVSREICKNTNCTDFELKAVFFQAIWQRHIKPDLYKPIQFDIPLRPEKKSPLDEFSYLYRRTV